MCAAQTEYSRLGTYARTRHRWVELRDAFREGWLLITRDEYLRSPVSRRDVRILIWPATCLAQLIVDTCSEGNFQEDYELIVIVDAIILVIGVFSVLLFAPQSLWSDFVCASSVLLGNSVIMHFHPSYTVGDPLVLVLFCTCGIHVGFALVYALCTYVFDLPRDPLGWISLALSLCIVWGEWMFDTRCARIVAELERERHAVHQLLQNAGHGSCTVNIDGGTIYSYTKKLADTLETADLDGVEFAKFVTNSDRKSLAELYDAIAINGVFVPILVTCRTPRVEFDAKIIPFAIVAKRVSLCIQVQGERRFQAHVTSRVSDAQAASSIGSGRRGRDVISHLSAFSNDDRSRHSTAPSLTSLALSVSTQARTRAEKAVQTDNAEDQGRPPLPDPKMRARSRRNRRGRGGGANHTSNALASGAMGLTLRQYPGNVESSSSRSPSPEPAAAQDSNMWLVPELNEDGAAGGTGFVLCCTTNTVVGCTVGFAALTGPLLFKTRIRDLVVNISEFGKWMHDEVNEMLLDEEHEVMPFVIKLARPTMKHHANFEFHARASIVACEEAVRLPEMGVEAGEDLQDEEYETLCTLALTDVQVQWVGGGTLLDLRTHRAVSDPEGNAASSSSEPCPAHEAHRRLIPRLSDDNARGAHSVLVCVDGAKILACTSGFNSLAGPLLFGTTLRDIVVNYDECMRWMHSQASELLATNEEEIPPFEIRIAPQIYKYRSKFEFHAVAHLFWNEAIRQDTQVDSHLFKTGEDETYVVVALEEVTAHWCGRRARRRSR